MVFLCAVQIYGSDCDSFLQGEVGEPGQKGSKADKGEQVGYGKSIFPLQYFTHLKYTM